MSRTSSKFVVLALVAALAIPLSARAPKRKRPHPAKPAAHHEQAPTPVPQPAQPAPELPPAPLRPEQLPPTPPQVTFQDNQLTIKADNSTLSSILNAVRTRTGATLDMPPDVSSERVAVRLGPGDPRGVVTELLQGSRFDYILLGSENDPNGLSQIILTARKAATGAAPAAVAGSAPATRPAPPMPSARSEDEESADTEPEPEPEPAPAPTPQAPVVAAPVIPPPSMTPPLPPDINNPAQQPDSQGQPQVKTPEQLLQELQRMRQQQQNRQPPTPGQPPPQ